MFLLRDEPNLPILMLEKHLHPFAESLELRDLTDDVTIFRSDATNHTDRVGLANVTTYSSVDGLPIYADHEYELISVYNNTSDVPQDSMAVLYLYLADHDFERKVLRRGERLAIAE